MTRAIARLRRFGRTPKGFLTGCLLLLALVAGRVEGWRLVVPGLAVATLSAVVLDLPLLRWRRGRWTSPTGAVLTGLLVAMVLSPREPLYVFAAAAAIAIASKYLLRIGPANLLNPAAAGLVAAFYLFDCGQNWWGALAAIEPVSALLLLVPAGLLVAHRVNRLPIALVFVGTCFTLFSAVAYLGDPASVADAFVPPDLYALIFFSGFMLTDPPTSPPRRRWQVACGGVGAVVSVAVFTWAGAAHYLLSGALAANLVDGVRRLRRVARPGRHDPSVAHAARRRA